MKSAALAAVILSLAAPAAAKPDPKLHAEALEILTKGVAYRTVIGHQDQTVAYATYLKDVLVKAGFNAADIRVTPSDGTAYLTARYPGRDRTQKPIVVLGHMDVVEAKREDWTRDPFVPVVENGYVYGRGAVDNKFDVSMAVATLAKLKREGWVPGRDIVLALSGDEETSMATTQKLAAELKGAELALNADGGGGLLDEAGKPVVYGLQAGEKTYADFTLTVTDPGGHSSRPGKTNAINTLATALGKIGAYQFPVMRSELTDAYFRASAPRTEGPVGEAMKRYVANPNDQAAVAVLAADPEYVGQLRTTCVSTMVSGGHAPNALPQRATANINCRIFPGTPSEQVRQELARVMGDPSVKIERVLGDGAIDSPASPLRPDVMAAVKAAVNARYPGLAIVPSMSAGATDSMHFRAQGVPSYGVAGLFMKSSDDFSHGLNERAPVAAIDGSLAHWESLLKTLAK
ncbi:M20/M25/M40 family metallo-hydrolase [Phenylobacterium sp.]|jgi:acetylornithine deacetylase/succinyl-diaminopimelate desuccinylase-like protein|uniref:M20/M25/M40 family metallo-hydrolase n=1 Tax=Phenylobacterium sp. TaxID=1871053 RepID=UPI002F93D22C